MTRVRTLRRRPQSNAFVQAELEGFKGLPWNMSENEEPVKVPKAAVLKAVARQNPGDEDGAVPGDDEQNGDEDEGEVGQPPTVESSPHASSSSSSSSGPGSPPAPMTGTSTPLAMPTVSPSPTRTAAATPVREPGQKRDRDGDPGTKDRQAEKFLCLPQVPDMPLHLGALYDREQVEERKAYALLESPDQDEHIFGPTALDETRSMKDA